MEDYVAPRSLAVRTCAASGTKFFDSNANGARDPGEPGIPRFLVWADYDNDGIPDANEPFSVTDSDGNYVVFDIRPRAGATCCVRRCSPAGTGGCRSRPTGPARWRMSLCLHRFRCKRSCGDRGARSRRCGGRSRVRAGTVAAAAPRARRSCGPESSEQALVAVVQQAYVCGVATRRVDQLVESLGLRTSRSEVSRICALVDERSRPSAGGR
jgi:hypothetical protein